MKTIIAVSAQPNFRLEINFDREPEHEYARFEISMGGIAPNLRSTVYKTDFLSGDRKYINMGEDEALHVSSGELTPFFLDTIVPFARELRIQLDQAFIQAPDDDEAVQALKDYLGFCSIQFTELLTY